MPDVSMLAYSFAVYPSMLLPKTIKELTVTQIENLRCDCQIMNYSENRSFCQTKVI